MPLREKEISNEQARIYQQSFEDAAQLAELYLRLWDGGNNPSKALITALSDAVVLGYCRPFFNSNDLGGTSFMLTKKFSYFEVETLNHVHQKLLEARRAIAHLDMEATGTTYEQTSAGHVFRVERRCLPLDDARAVQWMCERLSSELQGLWMQREVRSGRTDTSLELNYGQRELLSEADKDAIAADEIAQFNWPDIVTAVSRTVDD